MLTPEASRAARGALGWKLEDLASASGVALSTLSRFENGRPLRKSTAAKVVAALVSSGVELVAEENRTGVVLTRSLANPSRS